MIRKIYLSDDLCFEESLDHFLYKEKTTWDFIGYRQKALRVIVKASVDGRRASKEELFARVYDKEYDTFYNEERDGRRIKQLIRSVRQLLTKYDIELPRANKEDIRFQSVKLKPSHLTAKNRKNTYMRRSVLNPVCIWRQQRWLFLKKKNTLKNKNIRWHSCEMNVAMKV